MSPHVRREFAAAQASVDAWSNGRGGYNYPTSRALAIGTRELRHCWAKWTAAEQRAVHAARVGRRRRAAHHGRQITRWWMRAVRAQAVAIKRGLI